MSVCPSLPSGQVIVEWKGDPMDRLKGKVAIVTGAKSGVGAAIASFFAAEGAKVVMTARRREALEQVAAAITSVGGETLVVSTDISHPGDPERLVEAALEAFGFVDILVNNAGILEKGLKPIDRFEDEDLDRIVETNQKGTMRCMRAVSRRMERGASIVTSPRLLVRSGAEGPPTWLPRQQ